MIDLTLVVPPTYELLDATRDYAILWVLGETIIVRMSALETRENRTITPSRQSLTVQVVER
jgi:hypothetical protein